MRLICIVKMLGLALLIAMVGILLRPESWLAWAASAEGANNAPPTAAGEISEATIADLHAGLNGLAADVQGKIDDDIDITASSFWYVYGVERARSAADVFGSVLTAIHVGISTLSQFRNFNSIAEQLPQIAASGKWLSLGAYVVSLGAIKEAGNNLDWGINGPAYITGIKNMYQRAGEAGGETEFRNSVKTSLQKIVWVRAPQAERDRGVPTITYGTRVLSASIARRIETLKTRLSDQSIDPSALRSAIAVLKNLHTNMLKSRAGSVEIPVHWQGSQQANDALAVGSIAELRKVQGQLLDQYDAALKQRELTVTVDSAKSAGRAALLHLTFGAGQGLINVQASIPAADSLSWTAVKFAFKTDARSLVAEIPQQMLFSLSSEFSSAWHMVDAALSEIEELVSWNSSRNTQDTPSRTSRPTTADIRSAVDNEVRAKFKAGLQVIDVNKTDGQLGQMAGIPFYTLEFLVITEATQNLYQVFNTWDVYTSPYSTLEIAPSIIWTGEKYTLDGIANFTMKESGWVLQGVRVNRLSPSDTSAPSLTQAKHDIENIATLGSEKGCTCPRSGELKVINVTKESGARVTEGRIKYRLQFRAVVEGVTDDLNLDSGSGIFTKNSCPPHLCGPVCARSRQAPDCAAGQALENLFSNFRAPDAGERAPNVAPPSIRVGQTYVLDGTLDYIATGVGWWSAVSYRVAEPTLVPKAQLAEERLRRPPEQRALQVPPGGAKDIRPAKYVALGDSYSSGEGAIDTSGEPTFLKGTYTETRRRRRGAVGETEKSNECHRSRHAYPEIIKRDFGISDTAFLFRACSGAIEAEFYRKWRDDAGKPVVGQWTDDPVQLDAIKPDVELVTLTIGGNDSGFAQVLRSCVDGFFNWNTEAACLKIMEMYSDLGRSLLEGSGLTIRVFPSQEETTGSICDAQCVATSPGQTIKLPGLSAPGGLFQEIHWRAPKAKIRVLLYPRLFPANIPGKCVVSMSPEYSLTPAITTKLNAVTDALNALLVAEINKARETGIDILEADPNNKAFEGHRLCDNTGDPWINGIRLDDPFTPWNELVFSFHPNAAGQSHLAETIEATIP